MFMKSAPLSLLAFPRTLLAYTPYEHAQGAYATVCVCGGGGGGGHTCNIEAILNNDSAKKKGHCGCG